MKEASAAKPTAPSAAIEQISERPRIQLAASAPKCETELTAPKAKLTLITPQSNVALNNAIDFNLEQIKIVNKLDYPRLSWNRTTQSVQQTGSSQRFMVNTERCLEPTLRDRNAQIDEELVKFFERDQQCKELEVYYKCRLIQTDAYDAYLDDFIREHSHLNEFKYDRSSGDPLQHEFHELLKDYYEARLLVKKCARHTNDFKWQCLTNQMRAIWAFEKYTIESNAVCGDQQQVKHELTSEKAFLNKLELNKLQQMLYELRLNLVKSGLVSSQFCSKLARFKVESYLHDFLNRIRNFDFIRQEQHMKLAALNNELKVLVDILFYFNRKQAKPSSRLLNTLNGRNEPTKSMTKAENIYSELGEESTRPKDSETVNNEANSNEG